MLVLSRNIEESIVIGDDIRVKVVRVSGGIVRLGIDAPPGVTVHREEVYEAIRAENGAAAGLPPATVRPTVRLGDGYVPMRGGKRRA